MVKNNNNNKTLHIEPETPFHTLTVEQVEQHYSTNTLEGLTTQEATSRLKTYGHNELQGNGGIKWYKVLWRQVANTLVVILLIATVSCTHTSKLSFLQIVCCIRAQSQSTKKMFRSFFWHQYFICVSLF
jgi:magnesium-transporting ATPase (P-type)